MEQSRSLKLIFQIEEEELGRADHAYGTRRRGDAPASYQRLTLTRHSIEYFSPRVWNTLPQAIRDAPCLSRFKRLV